MTASSDHAEKRIYRLFGVCAALALAALVVPRFVPNSEGGFAGGAAAVLVLLLMLAGAFLVSLYLLMVTVRQYRGLSVTARVAGFGPSLVLAALLIFLFGFLHF